MKRDREQGFTLIELSIVLVIIGLLVGSVLVGRELIEKAQLRQVISNIERYKTAAMTFRDKYGAIPGDMANATNYWPLDPGCSNGSGDYNPSMTCNGNGDGLLGGADFSISWLPNFREVFGFWSQLALAGLIPGSYPAGGACGLVGGISPIGNLPGCLHTNMPTAPISYNSSAIVVEAASNGLGGTVAGLTNNRNTFVIALYTTGGGGVWPTFYPLGNSQGNSGGRVFTSRQAAFIDQKIDDGMPYSGNVLGSYDTFVNACGFSATGINAYTMTNQVVQGFPAPSPIGCALFINAGF